jgi:hypothetical protein
MPHTGAPLLPRSRPGDRPEALTRNTRRRIPASSISGARSLTPQATAFDRLKQNLPAIELRQAHQTLWARYGSNDQQSPPVRRAPRPAERAGCLDEVDDATREEVLRLIDVSRGGAPDGTM